MWPNPQFPADLVTFTEEILNEKLHFLCRVSKISKVEVHAGYSQRLEYFKRVYFQPYFTFTLRPTLKFTLSWNIPLD